MAVELQVPPWTNCAEQVQVVLFLWAFDTLYLFSALSSNRIGPRNIR